MTPVELSVFILAVASVGIYLAVDGIEDELVAWATRLVARKPPRSR